MKLYQHSIACAALDDEDERGCTCTESFPSHPTRAEEVRAAAASARVAHPYDAIYVMTAAAIEAAFSGYDGTLREGPDARHRAVDTR